MNRVMIGPMPLKGVPGAHLDLLREAGCETFFPPQSRQLSEEELLQNLPGCVASLAGSEPYTRRVLNAVPTLRVIARVGVGYDAVDLGAATEHGVAVSITPGANQEAAAEHTIALILALAKEIVPMDRDVKAGGWPRRATRPLRGQALGIVGLGRIGQAVAVRAAAFGMRLLAHEPAPDMAFVARHGIRLLPLEGLLALADYVSLHVPLTPESRHLIDRRTLALMKPSAFLVNTARGGLVCEEDLAEALHSGRLAGAGLDVFAREPPGDGPLGGVENVVLTPHTAGMDGRARDDMALLAAQSVVELLAGGWPADRVVNPEVRARFQAKAAGPGTGNTSAGRAGQ